MAGAGIKKFTTGEVLSDAEVNTYFMDQVVAVFPNAAARDAAFGGAGEPELSEGRLCYLQSTKKIQYYNGVSWSDSAQFDVSDGSITTDKLDGTSGSEAVTTAKVRDSAITTAKLDGTSGSEAVTTAKIRDSAITTAKLGSSLTLSGTTTVSGTAKLQQILEKSTVSSTPLTGLQTINVDNGAVYYYSAASTGDFQIKLTATTSLNSVMSNHDVATFVFFCTQGTTAYRLTAITIDSLSSGVDIRWFGGSSYPAGNSGSVSGNAVDVYTITVIKVANNDFDVFASQSSFKV
jgi:hypothetical protein